MANTCHNKNYNMNQACKEPAQIMASTCHNKNYNMNHHIKNLMLQKRTKDNKTTLRMSLKIQHTKSLMPQANTQGLQPQLLNIHLYIDTVANQHIIKKIGYQKK